MKTIVITGATGAVGRSLIKICIDAGYDVLVVVHRNSERTHELFHINHCHVLQLDLKEYKNAMSELEKQRIVLDGYELFFHLAWIGSFGEKRENTELQLSNVKYSLDAVQFAKKLGCKTFIGAGSQAEYGRISGVLSPSTPTRPETGYGIAKLCSGQLTRLLCEQLGMRHIWCRILSVYGPYDRDQTLISYAVRKMIANEETEFSLCNQMWDYIYSDDAARALLLSGQNGVNGSIYIIGSGEIHPLRDYIVIIAKKTNYSKSIGFGKKPYNEKQVMFLQADNSSLKELGFVPNFSFENGIMKTIQFFRERTK